MHASAVHGTNTGVHVYMCVQTNYIYVVHAAPASTEVYLVFNM